MQSCKTGAATNIIFGLALGYLSVIVPVVVVATCIFVGFTYAGMLGIACAALGKCPGSRVGAGELAVRSSGAGVGRRRQDALVGKAFQGGSCALGLRGCWLALIQRTAAAQQLCLDGVGLAWGLGCWSNSAVW